MNNIAAMVAAMAAGLLLGTFFFAGLFWTIKRGLLSKHPALWFFGSLIIRIAVTLGGFYLVSAGRWQNLALCVAGFFIARLLMFQYALRMKKTSGAEAEAEYASQSR